MNFNALVTLCEEFTNWDFMFIAGYNKLAAKIFDDIVKDYKHLNLFKEYIAEYCKNRTWLTVYDWVRYRLIDNKSTLYDEHPSNSYSPETIAKLKVTLDLFYSSMLKHDKWVGRVRQIEQKPHLKNDHDMELDF